MQPSKHRPRFCCLSTLELLVMQSMADKGEHHDQSRRSSEGDKSWPTASQVVAVVTLLPIDGILLTLSGLTLAGTVTGLILATPLFLLFIPIVVPSALAIAHAVAHFLSSGAFGLTGLSSLSWILKHGREPRFPLLEHVDYPKRQVAARRAILGRGRRLDRIYRTWGTR